jgi:hypothetical protein
MTPAGCAKYRRNPGPHEAPDRPAEGRDHQAQGTAGLALGPLLLGRAAQLLLDRALAGCVLGSLAGVVGFAARVADRFEERLVVRPAEALEDRPGRAVLLQFVHAGDHDGQLAVVHVEAVLVRGALPVPAGELGQLRDDGVGVAGADVVEDE